MFLNTLPYGAGITSSEALALCVPVVTLPSKVAVLQMTLAQIRAYGPRYESAMVARSAPDYIDKVSGSPTPALAIVIYTLHLAFEYIFSQFPS